MCEHYYTWVRHDSTYIAIELARVDKNFKNMIRETGLPREVSLILPF